MNSTAAAAAAASFALVQLIGIQVWRLVIINFLGFAGILRWRWGAEPGNLMDIAQLWFPEFVCVKLNVTKRRQKTTISITFV